MRAVGSVVAASTDAGGAGAVYAYGPFGETTGSGIVYRYAGQRRDHETKLQIFPARAYDPALGRFLSPDPIGYSDGANLYAYVGNDPINLVDPTGLYAAAAVEVGRDVWNVTQDYARNNPRLVNTTIDAASMALVAFDIANSFVSPGPDAVFLAAALQASKIGGRQATSAAARATEILKAAPRFTQTKTTIAVTETREGVRVVSSSERALRPAQRSLLKEGEIAATGPGHAEVTGVNAAKNLGLTPTGTAASRGICPACQRFLQEQGVDILSPLK